MRERGRERECVWGGGEREGVGGGGEGERGEGMRSMRNVIL